MSKFPNFNFPSNFPSSASSAEKRFIPNLRNDVSLAQESAADGVPEASISFAKMLFTGVWDKEQMKVDTLCDCLQPIPFDPRLDPYLILPRDPIRAVQILKNVVELPDPDLTFFINQARDLLVFCQVNGLAGFPAGLVTYPNAQRLPKADEDMLIANARSVNVNSSSSSYGFVPLPDARPEVFDPVGHIFKNVAISSRDKCFWIGSGFTVGGIALSVANFPFFFYGLFLTLVLIALPFGIFYYLIDFYGVQQKKPICDCQRIRLARELTFEEYPPSYTLNARDPFDSSPVKNLMRFKQIYFWVYMLAPVLVYLFSRIFASDFKYDELNRPYGIIFLFCASGYLFAVGTIALSFDKKTPKSCELSDGDDNCFTSIVLSLFFWFLNDSSCHEQAMVIIRKWHFNGIPEYAKVSTINKFN